MSVDELAVGPTGIGAQLLQSVLDPDRFGGSQQHVSGYLDLLADEPPPVFTFAQRLMRTRFYSAVYQVGRPIGRRLAGGIRAPGKHEDRHQIAQLLALRPGSVLADIGCGPGNFTGWFGDRVGESGLAVGIDASSQMLRKAVADNSGASVAYVRGDAQALPLRTASVDAASCLAALYLVNDPRQTVAEMARVVKPGGRVVILTSLAPPAPKLVPMLEKLTGVTWFGRDEVTGLLDELGFTDIERSTDGFAQTIAATKAVGSQRGEARDA